MPQVIESDKMIACPECNATLPEVRSKNPWCECGWSSVTDEWVLHKVDPRLRPMMKRSRERADKLAKVDKQAAELLTRPWGKRLWSIYLAFTVFLCLPVLTIKYIFYGIILTAWGYTVYLRIPILTAIVTLIMIAIVAYQQLTRPEKETLGISRNRHEAPELFVVLDEVAENLKTSKVSRVIMRLDESTSIEQKFVGYFKPQVEIVINIGLLDISITSMQQFKSIIAHELGHVRNKDTLLGNLLINQTLNTLYNWITPGPGMLILLYFLPFYILCSLYFRLLVFLSRWTTRRQEYLADRMASQTYGKSSFINALLSINTAHIIFKDYISTMIQMIENNFDRRDFYAQFIDHWNKMGEDTRQRYLAQAVASFNMVYATHPSYKDRVAVLHKLDDLPDRETDYRPAVDVLLSASELGRELTIQLYKKYRL